MAMNVQASDSEIILGSGELYLGFISDIIDLENLTTIEEEALSNIGAISGGSTITLGSEKIEVTSDNRGLIKKKTTAKNIKFSTGVITWVMENVSKFLLGATYADDTLNKEKKMVIGLGDSDPIVFLKFVHTKEDGTTLTVNIFKAQFDGEIGLVFNKDAAMSVNYEFIGLANDDNNYVEFVETYL